MAPILACGAVFLRVADTGAAVNRETVDPPARHRFTANK